MPSKKSGRGGGYEVGYGKPPKGTRFRRGVSGNPAGRRKASRTEDGEDSPSRSELDRVLDRKVTMIVDGEPRRVSLAEALAMQLTQEALAGNAGARRDLLRHLTGQRAKTKAEKPRPKTHFTITGLYDDVLVQQALIALGYVEQRGNEYRLHPQFAAWAVQQNWVSSEHLALIRKAALWPEGRPKP
jgi:hypothetical protein